MIPASSSSAKVTRRVNVSSLKLLAEQGAKAVDANASPLYLSRRLKERVNDCAALLAQGVEVSVTGMPTTARMPCSFAVRSVSSGKKERSQKHVIPDFSISAMAAKVLSRAKSALTIRSVAGP